MQAFDSKALSQVITQLVLEELQQVGLAPVTTPKTHVPAGVSARHVHVSREDMDVLFGVGSQLSLFKTISQPGQFAANEKITLIGPKGTLENVRILGPFRKETQVELAVSDARKLGVNPPIRESGNVKDSPGITLVGPKGSVDLQQGCIIAERHIHMTPADAKAYGVSDAQKVSVRVEGNKGGVMEHVSIKVREDFALEMHIDTDDSNAFGIKNGQQLEIIR